MGCNMHGLIDLWIAGCTSACPVGFAICTGALPWVLRGARALARRVLQYAQDARTLARRICNMHGRIPNGLAKITGACLANLQCAQAPTPWTCRMHRRLLGGFAICTGAFPCGLRGARALARRVCNMHGHIA
ncbi:hypothetical protein CRG98_001844 [Punica granatum]|uniref:Uncharacterized protein n=1 Tax=Punica granatum TaxID=22663 RepID=A0A2I0LAN1_PUNGR|nr:hypothetical protein CRG98_001844 [Punica granatum]